MCIDSCTEVDACAIKVKLVCFLTFQVGHTHQRFIGELEERSFSCEHLDSVDIVCWEVQEHDPVLDNLVEVLTENGIERDEIDISISL